jgi:hypothetical protein
MKTCLLALALAAAACLTAGGLRADHPCPPPGCPQIKQCVRVGDVKKTTRTKYSCKAEDRCLIFYCKRKGGSGLSSGHDCCDGCGDGCGKPRTVRRLVKKFVTEECRTTKCVPVVVDCPVVPCPAPVMPPPPMPHVPPGR